MVKLDRVSSTGWDRVAHLYDDAWGALTLEFVTPLVETADVASGQRVLDVACGPGYVAAAARGADAVGVDLSPAMVREARRRHPGIASAKAAPSVWSFRTPASTAC